jgi:pyruvate dehydrogenase E1 component alpha subunit
LAKSQAVIESPPYGYDLSPEQLHDMYRKMVLIRRFEEVTAEMYTRAYIGGFCHLNIGEEATIVGAISALQPTDYLFSNYREHGHAIAKGCDPREVMAELFGKETGLSKGRGGSMHLYSAEKRLMGGYAIVGDAITLAVGAAFAIKYRGTDEVVMAMFGDGATNIGAFHEALNMAALWNTPAIFVCVNNQYGMGTKVERASAIPEIYKKTCAYGIESIRVDGMNVLEMYKATKEMVDKTRKEQRPTFIEAVCYRYRGHSMSDPDRYRAREEKQEWMKKDAIARFEQFLLDNKVSSQGELDSIKAEVENIVQDAVEYAKNSPEPKVEELYRDVYVPGTRVGRRA